MSLPLWDVRHDCDLAGDRDRVVDELKRRDAARDRERESETQRLRPTFLVRSSTKGVKISSWAHGTVRHVPIAVDDNDWHSLPSGARAPSLEKLLVAIGYIDESNTDDDGEAEKHQYIALDELDRQQHAEQYAPPPFSKLQWQISDSDLTLDELPIAAGSFGQVFRGRLAPSGALVAVKVCKAKETLAAKAQTDFVNELSILRSLSAHENVVRFFGAVLDEASGAPVRLVLQFCSGGSLLTAIESKTWDGWRTSTKLRLLTGVARGLEHLHAHGVIHRDLAARNVLIEETAGRKGEWLTKVTDFGMARAVDNAQVGATTMNGVGPWAWMAPEQFYQRQYSAASDVFTFGIVAFELFARQTPWKGVSKRELAERVIEGDRLSFKRCKIPRELEQLVVQQCWAEATADRPAMVVVRQRCEFLIDQYN